ncbi:nuclear transport factor 2 family protein [Kordiimonas gwangyangensis]|uniref:nuclear transport factor 2 family protein n=1 Tax=Kordiimonas gwangyangensis TaxID=288022 RepID=UPI00037BB1A5|nr:nuclear transport factor 2 family protein [Kordiimonas gwangyangensis]
MTPHLHHIMKTSLSGFAALTLSAATLADMSTADILAQEALEQQNLKKAVRCMEILEVELDVGRFGRECVAEGHIEHAPRVPGGKEGLLRYFAAQLERFPKMHADIKRAGADGDLVWMHIHFKAKPDAKGNAGMHIFRMENGKFAEHWSVGQPVVDSTLHDNSMF